jgi:hypothetical protein
LNRINESLSKTAGNLQIKEEFYHLNLELGNEMNGLRAPEASCFKHRKDSTLLSKLVKTKPVLVLRYSSTNCNTCYEKALNDMTDVFGETVQSTIVLCSYLVERDFLIFKRVNQIKYPIYRIESDAFDWTVESYNIPYYFVLHPDMKISNVYIPNKSFPEMNGAYLESIKRLFN